jgi:hypothetical protein
MATPRFIHYEIWPVCEDGQTGIVEICSTWPCALKMAFRTHGRTFWRLYGRCHSGSEIAIGDFFSFPEAAKVYQLITGNSAPEEEGAYHRLSGGVSVHRREEPEREWPKGPVTVRSFHGLQYRA